MNNTTAHPSEKNMEHQITLDPTANWQQEVRDSTYELIDLCKQIFVEPLAASERQDLQLAAATIKNHLGNIQRSIGKMNDEQLLARAPITMDVLIALIEGIDETLGADALLKRISLALDDLVSPEAEEILSAGDQDPVTFH